MNNLARYRRLRRHVSVWSRYRLYMQTRLKLRH